MNAMRTFLVAAVAVLAVSLSVHGTAADKRIVLIAGKASHGPGEHEFRAGSLLLQKALSGVAGINVQVIPNGWPTTMVNGGRPIAELV